MKLFSNQCYCYDPECNQKEWSKRGMSGQHRWIVVSGVKIVGGRTPKCPHCKKTMTATADLETSNW